MYKLTDGWPMLDTLVKLRVKAIRVGNSLRVAIPSEIRKAAAIEEGDELLIDYDETSKKVTLEK
jgi:bifunctional DNA-binding transcriptional regulator/antitoxin component of YhaV-PrlF toxin-antitoxin module